VEFYLIFTLLGTLTGIGLMTINNIGNDATALWLAYDGEASKSFILKRQLFHVSIISLLSFCGRLLSGIGSDVLVKKLHTSRFWCLVASSSIFAGAQIAALNISNPHLLVLVSALTGLAYGALFGVAPSLVADAFGVHVLAINWGVMMLGPVIFGNIFNLCYGSILDANSRYTEDGDLRCGKGLSCYRNAYWITFVVSLVGVAVGLWSVRFDMVRKRAEVREGGTADEHLA
jgi:MFS family permease